MDIIVVSLNTFINLIFVYCMIYIIYQCNTNVFKDNIIYIPLYNLKNDILDNHYKKNPDITTLFA